MNRFEALDFALVLERINSSGVLKIPLEKTYFLYNRIILLSVGYVMSYIYVYSCICRLLILVDERRIFESCHFGERRIFHKVSFKTLLIFIGYWLDVFRFCIYMKWSLNYRNIECNWRDDIAMFKDLVLICIKFQFCNQG